MKTYAVILTTRPVEFQATAAHLQSPQEVVHHETGMIYQLGIYQSKQGARQVAVAQISTGESQAVEQMINMFHPRLLLLVGIARGLTDVRPGDVVAATKVYSFEAGKIPATFRLSSEIWHANHSLEQLAQVEARKNEWFQMLGERQSADPPRVFVGSFVVGEKVEAFTKLNTSRFPQEHYRDVLAVEMETHGFFQVIRAHPTVPALLIRGISDLTEVKNRVNASDTQNIAAQNAAAFAFKLLATFHRNSLPLSYTKEQEVWDADIPWFQARLRETSFSVPPLSGWEAIARKNLPYHDLSTERQAFSMASEDVSEDVLNNGQQTFAHTCQSGSKQIEALQQMLQEDRWTLNEGQNYDMAKILELEALIEASLSKANHSQAGLDFNYTDQLKLLALLLETLKSLMFLPPRHYSSQGRKALKETAIQVCQDLLSNLTDLQHQMLPSDFVLKPPISWISQKAKKRSRTEEPIEIFCCYAHEDQSHLLQLKKHLAPLVQSELINTVWREADLSSGANREGDFDKHLDVAQIILLLVSPDFLASDYCCDKEIERAVERHNRGEATVIPILLRPTPNSSLQKTPLGKLQTLPRSATPLTSWSNQDKAFADVACSIQKAIKERATDIQ